MRPAELILRNSIRCTACDTEVVSEHRHDFRGCRCGAVAVDGGQTWLRRLGGPWVDTSIVAVREENDKAAVAETAAALEAWRIVDLHRVPPMRVIVCVVTGHPDFDDGVLLATTGVVALEPEAAWARTSRRFYRLGGRQQ